MNRIIPIAFAMSLMFSPDSLVLLGNSVGMAGVYSFCMLIIGMSIHLLTIFSYGQISHTYPGPGGEIRHVRETMGRIPAIIFPVCSRVVLTVCAATGILATAGYIFNEIFVNWFPNLGFSFAFLGFLLLIGLLGRRAVSATQIISMTLVLLGLFYLSLRGLMASNNLIAAGFEMEESSFNLLHVCTSGLVILIGFDLAEATWNPGGEPILKITKLMTIAIMLAVLTMALWGTVSYIYVSPKRLMDTSVPYSLVAREIMGMPGRKIMGLIVIAAACGVVNGLLTSVSKIISIAFSRDTSMPIVNASKSPAFIPLILLSVSIGLMLATGMAGEPHLEVFTRGGIYLWLLNYSVIHLSVLIFKNRHRQTHQSNAFFGFLFLPVIGFLSVCAGVFGLIWLDPDTSLVIKFMVAVLAVSFVMSLSVRRT